MAAERGGGGPELFSGAPWSVGEATEGPGEFLNK